MLFQVLNNPLLLSINEILVGPHKIKALKVIDNLRHIFPIVFNFDFN
jgi:hypothetical protein